MSWTTLIAEYLVVGCLAALWIVFMVLATVGSSPGAMLEWMNDLPAQMGSTLVFVLLAGFYSLGTAVDHLCYLATLPYLKWYNRRNWDRFIKPSNSPVGTLFHSTEEKLLGEGGKRDRLLRRRGRIRILRALFLQTPLIGGGIWLHYRSGGIIVAFLVLWILTGLALYYVFKQFLRMIARAAREEAA
jgi:hypothetical protein